MPNAAPIGKVGLDSVGEWGMGFIRSLGLVLLHAGGSAIRTRTIRPLTELCQLTHLLRSFHNRCSTIIVDAYRISAVPFLYMGEFPSVPYLAILTFQTYIRQILHILLFREK
jgi:hypothetical protein